MSEDKVKIPGTETSIRYDPENADQAPSSVEENEALEANTKLIAHALARLAILENQIQPCALEQRVAELEKWVKAIENDGLTFDDLAKAYSQGLDVKNRVEELEEAQQHNIASDTEQQQEIDRLDSKIRELDEQIGELKSVVFAKDILTQEEVDEFLAPDPGDHCDTVDEEGEPLGKEVGETADPKKMKVQDKGSYWFVDDLHENRDQVYKLSPAGRALTELLELRKENVALKKGIDHLDEKVIRVRAEAVAEDRKRIEVKVAGMPCDPAGLSTRHVNRGDVLEIVRGED